MESNFLQFEMHKNNEPLFVKPGEITSISPAPEGGSRLVTRQKQVYYIVDEVVDVEAMIRIYFKKLKGEY